MFFYYDGELREAFLATILRYPTCVRGTEGSFALDAVLCFWDCVRPTASGSEGRQNTHVTSSRTSSLIESPHISVAGATVLSIGNLYFIFRNMYISVDVFLNKRPD